ncbi:MAG: thioredoxin family protein [Phycisphaerales bacterium]|jgi:thiol:disulfide interchange protein
MGVGAVRKRGNGFLIMTVLIFVGYLTMSRLFGNVALPPAFSQHPTLINASTAARQSGKPVLALAAADWCSTCRAFKAGALRDPGVDTWISQNTHAAYLDFTNSPGEDGLKLNISAVPTLVLLRDGKEVGRLVGDVDTKALLAWLSDLSGPVADWKAAHPGQTPPELGTSHAPASAPSAGG